MLESKNTGGASPEQGHFESLRSAVEALSDLSSYQDWYRSIAGQSIRRMLDHIGSAIAERKAEKLARKQAAQG
jgi:hypothetical protein